MRPQSNPGPAALLALQLQLLHSATLALVLLALDPHWIGPKTHPSRDMRRVRVSTLIKSGRNSFPNPLSKGLPPALTSRIWGDSTPQYECIWSS